MNNDYDNAHDDKWALETFGGYPPPPPHSLQFYCRQAAERMMHAAAESRRKRPRNAHTWLWLASETCARAVDHYGMEN